ncbi:hypothetical protein SK128_027829 [Halocaridina rubra]|uniref:C-type lectin domain-containing protein n=1 Tax=Halocaridina rubra TaxID=373956 RepID=A0AAN9A532_HALRR
MLTVPGVGGAATTFLGATAVALLFFAGGKAEREEETPQDQLHHNQHDHNQHNHPDFQRILKALQDSDKRISDQLHEWKNKTEHMVTTLLEREDEWKQRAEILVSEISAKEEDWRNRTEEYINSLLDKDTGLKNGTKDLDSIYQPKTEGCSNNATESLVSTILDKESEWVTRSETLIHDTDNLKKLVRGLLFREAEAKKKIIALTTMVRNLLTFSGVARCESPFKVVPYVGCIFLDRVGSTWEEGRTRCQEMGADIFIGATSKQFLHLSRYYKNNDPGNTDIWVGVKGGVWLNGREPEKEEWIPGDPDDGEAGCGHLEAWSQWNNTPRRFLLSDHMCHGKAWTVCHKRP